MDTDRIPAAELRFGAALSENGDIMTPMIEALARALSQETGLRVKSTLAPDYATLLDKLVADKIQIAWLPPVVAYRAIFEHKCASTLAMPVRDGSTTYSSALFTNGSSPIRSIDDLHGVKAAWVHTDSIAGFLLPRAMLKASGLALAEAFAKDRFYESHAAVVKAVVEGRADVGATYCYVDKAGEGGIIHSAWGDWHMRVLATYGPIPSDQLVVQNSLTKVLVERLQKALTDAYRSPCARIARALLDTEGFKRPEADHRTSLRMYAGALADEIDDHTPLHGGPYDSFESLDSLESSDRFRRL